MKKLLPVVLTVVVLALCAYALYYNFRYVRDYPMGFEASVCRWADEYEVPRELVFAVINVESGFDADAKSKADAYGLMQLLEPTCDEIAWRLGIYEDCSITDPDTNIRFGTYYLSHLYRYFGSWRTAIAAYNAGIGRVSTWLENKEYSDDGVNLKEIPIKETKNYVETVLSDMDHYAELLNKNEENK